MNEEEKQSIEILNSQLLKTDGYDRHQKAIDIILNLIDKQQKEIVRLQNIIKRDILQDLISIEKVNIYKNYVSKDKIKEITSVAERDCQDYAIQVLKELLED